MPEIIAILPKNAHERTRVALDQYQGLDLIDIRACTQIGESAGVWSPGKKGISLRVQQLPALIEALQRAEVRAREAGMIGGAE